MRLISLVRFGKVVAHAQVDDEDHDRLAKYSWRLNDGGYAVRNTTITNDGVRTAVCISMHREVLGLHPGDPMCDHRNRDRLDCRRLNLRLITPQGNSENRGPQRGSRSGVRGVSWHASAGKWQVTVWVRGESHYLGLYADLDEAGAVASAFRVEHMPDSLEFAA